MKFKILSSLTLILIVIAGAYYCSSMTIFSFNLPLLLILCFVFIVLIWIIPRQQVKKFTPKDTSQGLLEDAFRRTIIQICGGAILFAGLYFSWNSLDLSRKNLELLQKRNTVDTFSRAIEQLGQIDSYGLPKLETRLGGIYTLIELAKTSDEYYLPIISIFNAYIRSNCSLSQGQDNTNQPLVREDIQPMLHTIGSLDDLGYNTIPYLNLENLNLSGYSLAGLYFNHASFSGSDLSKASLQGAQIIYTTLENVSLQGANLEATDFTYGSLSDANLKDANLDGTSFGITTLEGVNFTGASLKDVNFYYVDLTKTKGLTCEQIQDSTFEECKLPDSLMSCTGVSNKVKSADAKTHAATESMDRK